MYDASLQWTGPRAHTTTLTKILLLSTALMSSWSVTLAAQNVAPVPKSLAVSHLDSAGSGSKFAGAELNSVIKISSSKAVDSSVSDVLPVDGNTEQLTLSARAQTSGGVKPGKNGTVTVSPATAIIVAAQTQQLIATVTGMSNTAVTWTASSGTVSLSGLYTAPASISAQTTATVTATSAADPTKGATATVTLIPPVTVSMTPGTATLTQGQTQQFSALVTGTTNSGVTWTTSAGMVSAAGLYTAPASIPSQTTATVTATSVADPTKMATATVILNPGWSISGAVTPSSLGTGTMLTLSGATTAQVTANSSGNYSFAGLANGTYIVTPTKSGVVFVPATQTLTINGANVVANFAAANQTWSISGVVYGSPATLTLSGTAAASTTTDNMGQYTFTGLSGGSYVVAPSQSGYIFTPSTTLVNLANAPVSGVNFTAQPSPPSVALSWTASTSLDVAGYNLYRATVTGGPYQKLTTSPVPSLTYQDLSVSRGQAYYYVATAVDTSGNESSYSIEATALVPAS